MKKRIKNGMRVRKIYGTVPYIVLKVFENPEISAPFAQVVKEQLSKLEEISNLTEYVDLDRLEEFNEKCDTDRN